MAAPSMKACRLQAAQECSSELKQLCSTRISGGSGRMAAGGRRRRHPGSHGSCCQGDCPPRLRPAPRILFAHGDEGRGQRGLEVLQGSELSSGLNGWVLPFKTRNHHLQTAIGIAGLQELWPDSF